MIDFTALEDALYDWAFGVVTPVPVIWADQNAPRPDSPTPTDPYVTLRHTAFNRIGDDFAAKKTDNTGVVNVTGNREFSLFVQGIGAGSLGRLEALRTSLQKFSIKESLRASGLVFVQDLTGIQNVAEILDAAQYQEQRSIDFLFRIAQTYTDTVGAIDNTEIEGDTFGVDGNLVKNETFQVTQ